MFDPVLADLAVFTRCIDRRDARDEWVEERSSEIEKGFIRSAERFSEVMDSFTEDDWFPLERVLLQFVKAGDDQALVDAAMELRLLLKHRTQSIALDKAQVEAKQHYQGEL